MCLIFDKKRRYWPKDIAGDGIKAFMKDKQVGYQEHIPGEVDIVGFDIFATKDPDFTMMIMSTYGQLVVKKGQMDNIKNIENPSTGE